HLSLYRDETSRRSTWHAPLAHYLEAWGDSLSVSGSRLIAQPLIAPLFDGLSVNEFLAFAVRESAKDGAELVRRALDISDDAAWAKAVHDGCLPGSETDFATPTLKALAAVKVPAEALGGLQPAEQLELTFVPDSRIYDGRYANNGWLQEAPEHAMKLTWDNAAFINPKTAEALGIKDCTLIKITTNGKTVEVPALMSPGQAPGSLKVLLGFG